MFLCRPLLVRYTTGGAVLRFIFLVCLLTIVPWRAYADNLSKQEILSSELALITGSHVNLRTDPSPSATVIRQLPMGSWIRTTNNIKNSGGHSWRQVFDPRCAPYSCRRLGWLAEGYIALASSFARVTKWEEQFLTDRLNGDGQMNFHLHLDGTVTGDTGFYGTGVMLRKDRFVLLRFNHRSQYLGDVEIYDYYALYVINETSQLCSIDDGVLGSGGIRRDTCTRPPN